MVRRPRVYFPGALHRVIARGNRKQDIFSAEMDFRANRLCSMTRDRLGAHGRALVAYLARKLVGQGLKRLPRILVGSQ